MIRFLLLAALLLPAVCFSRTFEAIQTAGEISVCANPNALPFASQKADPPGFQIEIARAIAAKLGVKLHTDWIIPRMRASTVDCDLLMDTILVKGVQPPSIKLSIPYHASGVSLAFAPGREPAKSYAELKPGTRVGVLHNSVASLVVSKTRATMVPFAFEDDMLEALGRGEIDAGAVSPASAGYFNLKNSNSLKIVHAEDSEPELAWSVGVGMRRADEALVSRVNEAISALLADGTIAAIYGRYGVEHRKP